MLSGIIAGLLYTAIVFAAGTVLGALRALLVTPLVGEWVAVLFELPVILLVSWIACLWAIARVRVPPTTGARLVMGAVAFIAVLCAEAALVVLGMGASFSDFLNAIRSPPGMLGLAGQLLFALFPLLQLRRSSL